MATCDWVKETVSHIIKNGMAEISTLEKLLHGHIDVSVIENEGETLSFTNRNHSISLTEQCTNDERFRAFCGSKHLLLDICKYYTQNNIVIFDKQSKTYVSILIDTSRIMKRFRMNMYSGVKTIVYKQLYDFYYMTNINFDDVEF